MIVVSDTSPISNLHQIGRLELLRDLYGRVLIPPAVANELRAARDIHDDLDWSLREIREPWQPVEEVLRSENRGIFAPIEAPQRRR